MEMVVTPTLLLHGEVLLLGDAVTMFDKLSELVILHTVRLLKYPLFSSIATKNFDEDIHVLVGFSKNLKFIRKLDKLGIMPQSYGLEVFKLVHFTIFVTWISSLVKYARQRRKVTEIQVGDKQSQNIMMYGFSWNSVPWNSMISYCNDSGNTEFDVKLFAIDPIKNMVVWTLMMAGSTPKEASSASGNIHDMTIVCKSLCIALKGALDSNLDMSYHEHRSADFTKSKHHANQFHLKCFRGVQVAACNNMRMEDELEKYQTCFCVYANKGGGAESITELYKEVHDTVESTKNMTLLRFTIETQLPIKKLLTYGHGTGVKTLSNLVCHSVQKQSVQELLDDIFSSCVRSCLGHFGVNKKSHWHKVASRYAKVRSQWLITKL